jgi:eukaryotic-like serine/threonine-protein kinase
VTYVGHSGDVYSVAWSPDGTRIASGAEDGTMQLWNARDGSQLFTYPDNYSYQVFSVAWSPDSTRLATGSDDGTVQVWQAV